MKLCFLQQSRPMVGAICGAMLLGGLCVGQQALALPAPPAELVISGKTIPAPVGQLRLGAWMVSSFGQPVQELGSVALGESFTLRVPATPPTARQQMPLGERVTWPALIFEKASQAASVAELRFFVYTDANKNKLRDADEPLREVTLSAPSGEVFVVWSSAPTVVSGSKGYQAKLQAGWNLLTVSIQGSVGVNELGSQNVTLRLGR